MGATPSNSTAQTASVMGSSTPMARARSSGARAAYALGRDAAGQDVGQLAAGADFQAHAAVARQFAGRGQYQVAQAGQAGEGFGLRAQGDAETGHFGQAARDQRGAGVGAQRQAVADAAGHGDDVLERAPDFHADQVGAGVDAQRGAVQGLGGGGAQGSVAAGDGQRHGQALRDFAGKGRAR